MELHTDTTFPICFIVVRELRKKGPGLSGKVWRGRKNTLNKSKLFDTGSNQDYIICKHNKRGNHCWSNPVSNKDSETLNHL